jgi:hypothetical protein
MTAIGWLIGRYKGLPAKWQYRAQGIALGCALLTLVSAVNFLYIRWSIDPRLIPASEIDHFTAALGKYDPTQIITVFCFKADPSSCAIAGQYQTWLADHWSMGRGPQFESDAKCPRELVNRVWVYTQFVHDRPSGAITLHKALDQAGMNMDPGYRLNGAMGPNAFGFGVGCSH